MGINVYVHADVELDLGDVSSDDLQKELLSRRISGNVPINDIVGLLSDSGCPEYITNLIEVWHRGKLSLASLQELELCRYKGG